MQVVHLQEDKDFKDLGVELLSISPDPADARREEGREMGIRDFETGLTDRENKVATSYGVMLWAMGGEPGHTFVLVDGSGEVIWLHDYGATPACSRPTIWRVPRRHPRARRSGPRGGPGESQLAEGAARHTYLG